MTSVADRDSKGGQLILSLVCNRGSAALVPSRLGATEPAPVLAKVWE